jgi:FMN hydrolase / 5-amino-6-(5-phospho-D-ribitylamino)uracil phosphatase
VTVLAITLDLDDTLWPIWPAMERAERALLAWLQAHAPATAAAHDVLSLRLLRDAVARERPEWVHDLSAIRRESIRRALQAAGDDASLAEAAFEVFFDARQKVDLFDDVHPALSRLAARFPLIALSNGNADLRRTGVAAYFSGGITAREFGRGKPDAAIFHEACRRAGCAPARALHVGDDAALDVDGALAAGLRAAWLRRPGLGSAAAPLQAPHHVVERLDELADLLGA